MERFKIFPSIGIARVGGGDQKFFLCPEKENSAGVEIDAAGNETEVVDFKDASGRIKRQGARFRIFELDDDSGEYIPLKADDVVIEWQVQLVNMKAAVSRAVGDNHITISKEPPSSPPNLPLTQKPNFAELTIDGGVQTISGQGQGNVRFDQGMYKNDKVFLGELKTDKDGNLIVLGGRGKSRTPSGKPFNEGGGDFYYTEDWYDDTSDGFVKATVKKADGSSLGEALSAWVIVAPPDYAPGVKAVVTLYDIMEEVAVRANFIPSPSQTSFSRDILPLIRRLTSHTWVHDKDYSIPHALPDLNSTDAGNKAKRTDARARIRRIESRLKDYALTSVQMLHLNNWEAGNFIGDLDSPPPSLQGGEMLTKLALDTTAGQGFFPGIEAGIIVRNSSIYNEPYRIDATRVRPGNLTGLMALPWQADFLKCRVNWWPSQRPDQVKLADGTKKLWERGILPTTPAAPDPHQNLIDNFEKLGFVKKQGAEQIENERSL